MQLMSETSVNPIVSNEDSVEDNFVVRDLELKEINDECYLLGKRSRFKRKCYATNE